ncbi:MAG: DUF4412 domain-containing protein [Cyclobacteriaceae bacterium]|nr:DUF4412 domain-containing protein [Cyclobacteriaceae bacterium]
MKSTITNLSTALCLLFIYPAQGQFLDRLQKRAEQKLEDRALQKADQGIDKGLDKTEEVITDGMTKDKTDEQSTTETTESDRATQEKMMQMLGGNATPASVADTYSFSSGIVYDMTTESGKNSTTMEYTMLFNPNADYIGTQLGDLESDGNKTQTPTDITTIMDFENNAMVIIMKQQNMAQIMTLDKVKQMSEPEAPQEETKVEKTGKTKDILGYRCEEYLLTSENTNGAVWIAPDLKVLSKSYFKSLGNANLANKQVLQDIEGMMLEMDMNMEDEKGKPMHMAMKAKSIDREPASYTMADYQQLNLGGMGKE